MSTTFTVTEPHTSIILKEMFARVGANIEGFDFSKENWYWDYEWTEEEEKAFIDWVADYLVKNKLAHKGSYRGKKYNLHQAEKIVHNYGWRLRR